MVSESKSSIISSGEMRKGKDIASPIARKYVISKHVHTQNGDKRSVENYGVQNKAAGYREYVHSQTKSR